MRENRKPAEVIDISKICEGKKSTEMFKLLDNQLWVCFVLFCFYQRLKYKWIKLEMTREREKKKKKI